MKRILVLIAVLALMLSLFAGCGRYGEADDGTNVSTTDNGTQLSQTAKIVRN